MMLGHHGIARLRKDKLIQSIVLHERSKEMSGKDLQVLVRDATFLGVLQGLLTIYLDSVTQWLTCIEK